MSMRIRWRLATGVCTLALLTGLGMSVTGNAWADTLPPADTTSTTISQQTTNTHTSDTSDTADTNTSQPQYPVSMLAGVTATIDGTLIPGFTPTQTGSWSVTDPNRVRINNLPDGWTMGIVNEPVVCDPTTRQCTSDGHQHFRIDVTSPDRLTRVSWTFTTATTPEPEPEPEPEPTVPDTNTNTDTGKDATDSKIVQVTPASPDSLTHVTVETASKQPATLPVTGSSITTALIITVVCLLVGCNMQLCMRVITTRRTRTKEPGTTMN